MSKEVIIFSSPTCAPCKQLKPELESQSKRRGFSLRVVEMTFANQAEFVKYGVRSVPTVICLEDDREIGRFTGAMTTPAVDAKLTEWSL